MTITEIEALELLDFDHEPSCGTVMKDCPNTPEWRLIALCCDERRLLCTPCKQDYQAIVAKFKLYDDGFTTRCRHCGNVTEDDDNVRFEQL